MSDDTQNESSALTRSIQMPYHFLTLVVFFGPTGIVNSVQIHNTNSCLKKLVFDTFLLERWNDGMLHRYPKRCWKLTLAKIPQLFGRCLSLVLHRIRRDLSRMTHYDVFDVMKRNHIKNIVWRSEDLSRTRTHADVASRRVRVDFVPKDASRHESASR